MFNGIFRIYWHQHHVDAGHYRLVSHAVGMDALIRAFHLHRIAENDAVEAHLFFQKPSHHVLRYRRREVLHRLNGRHVKMSDHSTCHALIYQIFKWIEFNTLQIFQFLVDLWQRLVRVVFRVAVTRKMLHRRQHSVVLKCQRILSSTFGHSLRVGAEAAHPDDRILRLVVDVDIRRKVDIYSNSAALLGNLSTHLAYKFLILNGSQRHLVRIRDAVVETHPESPFAVDANHQRRLRHRLPFVHLLQQRLGIGTEKRHATDVIFFNKSLNLRKIRFIRQVSAHVYELSDTLLGRQRIVNRVDPAVFGILSIGN